MATGCYRRECTIQEAIDESVVVADTLQHMAQQAESASREEPIHIQRRWTAAAATYTYHTHVRVRCADNHILDQVADCFFYAASLTQQPWYKQFLRGRSLAVQSPARGCQRAALCWPEFDFGLGKTHSYRQLVSDFSLATHCRVLVLRSVIHEQDFPADTVRAYTLAPTGDVLHWQDGVLHWHHICTVAGVGILPPLLERYVMNGLRWLRLDMSEKNTYREEAEAFIRWISDPAGVTATWQTLPAARLMGREDVS